MSVVCDQKQARQDRNRWSKKSLGQNYPKFICPNCLPKPKSLGFWWKKASLGVRSPWSQASKTRKESLEQKVFRDHAEPQQLPKTQERSLDPLLLALFSNTPKVLEYLNLWDYSCMNIFNVCMQEDTLVCVSDKSFIGLHVQIKQDLLIKNQWLDSISYFTSDLFYLVRLI